MGNTGFEFKQFRINQNKTAMKVGTDGVLLGSIANCQYGGKILDIGTGTGLISLMMAQRFPSSQITAIEPEPGAFEQAGENVELSPWGNRIQVLQNTLESFSPKEVYDCIVSNPPFYRNALKPENKNRAQARLAEALPPESILKFTSRHLAKTGSLWLIYPANELEFIETQLRESDLCMHTLTFIKPNILKPAHRIITEIKKEACSHCRVSMFSIEILKRHDYTQEYKTLGKDFYLNF